MLFTSKILLLAFIETEILGTVHLLILIICSKH